MSQQPHPAYTPASFAFPAMNTTPQGHSQSQVQGQQQQQQPRRRGRPPRQPAPPAPETHPSLTETAARPTMNNAPVHPAYRPPPPQPQNNLIQVDAEIFTRLVQQVQSHQAIIDSLQARINILEQARFSYNPSTSNGHGQSQNAQQKIHDSGDSDSEADSDSNSPIQQLLTEINRSDSSSNFNTNLNNNTNSTPKPSQPNHPQTQSYLVPHLNAGWSQPNYTNPVPPPNQIKDMAYPPEGLRFAFLLTIDPQSGRKWIGGGSHGASAVLNAWTGPHGYRILTRRSKIKAGRYYLTICCAWSSDKHRAKKTSPTEEELEEARADGRGKPYQRKEPAAGDMATTHDCPFRFVMKQVEIDGGLFEVRWMRNSGVSAPHNHGPDPMAMVPKGVRTRF